MTRLILSALGVLVIAQATVGCASEPSGDNSAVRTSQVVQNDSVNGVLPEDESLFVRTDFTDDAAWRAIVEAVNKSYQPEGLELMYGLTVVDDPAFANVTIDGFEKLLTSQSYVYIVDEQAIRHPEHPILVVDHTGLGEPGPGLPTFRILPREVGLVEVNLTLANMDFEDFAYSVDADGVFRGFGD
ncbi:DUF6924 domain-containing protein [Nocardia sp. NPDC058058]|uniref:DUF6924 domain-containing protein n=1 Tax=Nocardia sp. NPDC058058 TaxID=3346317 RepID=UPI0036DDB92D